MHLARVFSRHRHGAQGDAAGDRAGRPLEDAAQAGRRASWSRTMPEYPRCSGTFPIRPRCCLRLGNQSLLRPASGRIVGSRDHSSYGAEVCRSVAGAAAAAGVVIVSGMARGLDAVAHTAALDAGGTTIGVLGNGLGVIYPAANRALYERVAGGRTAADRVSSGRAPPRGQLPPAEPADQRALAGHGRGRGGGRVRRPHHGRNRAGSGQGSDGGAGEHHQPALGGHQSADPGRRRSGARAGRPAPALSRARAAHRLTGTLLPPNQRGRCRRPCRLRRAGAGRAVGRDADSSGRAATQISRPIGDVLGLLGGLEIAGVVEQGPGRCSERLAGAVQRGRAISQS